MALTLTSPAFSHDGAIPTKHTCDGENLSPSLSWTNIPATAKSLALIVDDPDAPDPEHPRTTWVHWVLYDIPITTNELPEGTTPAKLPPGAKAGLNDWKQALYGGPCPPVGRHRYVHKLYALNAVIGDQGALTKSELEEAMAGHVIEHAELVGTYERVRPQPSST